MLSPRVLVRGNPARAKFAAENNYQVVNRTAFPWNVLLLQPN